MIDRHACAAPRGRLTQSCTSGRQNARRLASSLGLANPPDPGGEWWVARCKRKKTPGRNYSPPTRYLSDRSAHMCMFSCSAARTHLAPMQPHRPPDEARIAGAGALARSAYVYVLLAVQAHTLMCRLLRSSEATDTHHAWLCSARLP